MRYEDFVENRNENDPYPRLDFVITKYDPQKYNADGIYTDDKEWTGIDEAFRNGHALDYITKEDAFIEYFKAVLDIKRCRRLVIHMWSGYNDDYNTSSRLLNTSNLYWKYKHLKDYSMVDIPTACDLLRLSLRGGLDCSLVNMSYGIEFMVGYEYYLHIRCPGIDYRILEHLAERTGLFLNPRANVSSQSIIFEQLLQRLQSAKHGDIFDPKDFEKKTSSEHLYETLFLSDTVLCGNRPRLKAAVCLSKPRLFTGSILSWDDIKPFQDEAKLLIFQFGRKVGIGEDIILIGNYPMEWKEYRTGNNVHYLYL